MLNKLHMPLLEEVGNDGFSGCKNLTELNLPALKVCNGFYGCTTLSSLILPNLVEIGSNAF